MYKKVWHYRNVGSFNQIAPFQIDYVMRTLQKIRGLRLITSGDLPLHHPPTVSSRPLALSGPDLSVYELTSDFNATHYSNDYHPFISCFNPLVPIYQFPLFLLYPVFILPHYDQRLPSNLTVYLV